ncbi:hypothetical protein GCM10012284_12370 [Mangrovihabitans endophyticus]|uniref:ATPase AAA-3 domain-containing protein n=1 Tax=Mangrovihabitans endophyticus TaxID=1751298 RepID=A0A8J3BXC9_9ACTN|nr:hypothetical protein GCM10012284_12370 [Mangrovihabitans endophyticus]
MTPATAAALATAILDETDRVVVAKRDAVRTMLLGVLAGGHILIEDHPGLGKTLIAKSLAAVLGLSFTRIQFTPDLMPADITGAVYLDPASSDLRFRAGPVFTQMLLADEINRATPKTQSALLEAMAEHHVTADGHTHRLPQPFIVLATDNPIDLTAPTRYPKRNSTGSRFGERSATSPPTTRSPCCTGTAAPAGPHPTRSPRWQTPTAWRNSKPPRPRSRPTAAY